MRKLFLLALTFALPSFALADNLSANNEEALRKTQALLNDPALRANAAMENQKTKDASQYVRDLTVKSGTEQEVYALSAQVMDNLVKQTGGDPEKMFKLLEEAGRNPSAFAANWTPEQKAKLHELANRIDAAGGPTK